MIHENTANTGGVHIRGEVKTARGPFGGTYSVVEFFPAMVNDWEKAARCLKPLLPDWLIQAMYGKVLSRNSVEIIDQYQDLAEVQRHVSAPLTEQLNDLLTGGSFVTVSAAYCKVRVNGTLSFGVMINIVHQSSPASTPLGHFEGFVNLQDRTKWKVDSVPDVNERTPNDPAWLIQSKTTRMNGLWQLPMPMRLDMHGQYCVEDGWTEYKVYGQQLLLIADVIVRKK